jgi:hypothetical protein
MPLLDAYGRSWNLVSSLQCRDWNSEGRLSYLLIDCIVSDMILSILGTWCNVLARCLVA